MRSVGSNPYEVEVLENIREHGWHFTFVGSDEDTPCFGYTVGMVATYEHPELLVIGLPPKLSHSVCSIAATAAQKGTPLDPDLPCDAFLEGHETLFVPVEEPAYRNYVLSALWFYEDEPFRVLQVVWPSHPEGFFPWHPDAPADYLASQPVLGAGSPAA